VFNGHDLALDDARFIVSPAKHSADVAVYHPAFADLPPDPRLHIAYLCLDWALGEHAVEVWIGAITAVTSPTAGLDTVDGLRRVVADLAAQHEEPQWAMLDGRTPGGEVVLATVQVPLRSARWPRFDTHVSLTLPFDDQGNGLPDQPALALLREFEDSVAPVVGHDGELLARETRNGIRTLHYYVDGRTEVPDRLAQVVSGWRRGRSRASLDPSLAEIGHLAF
jgi:hypothetical protein